MCLVGTSSAWSELGLWGCFYARANAIACVRMRHDRYLLMPIILATLVGVVVVVRLCIRRFRQSYDGDSWSVYWSTLIVAISLVHTVMSKAYFSVFDVYPDAVAGRWCVVPIVSCGSAVLRPCERLLGFFFLFFSCLPFSCGWPALFV